MDVCALRVLASSVFTPLFPLPCAGSSVLGGLYFTTGTAFDISQLQETIK
jgi:hypothetical protein